VYKLYVCAWFCSFCWYQYTVSFHHGQIKYRKFFQFSNICWCLICFPIYDLFGRNFSCDTEKNVWSSVFGCNILAIWLVYLNSVSFISNISLLLFIDFLLFCLTLCSVFVGLHVCMCVFMTCQLKKWGGGTEATITVLERICDYISNSICFSFSYILGILK
jgi:hypothetical protein